MYSLAFRSSTNRECIRIALREQIRIARGAHSTAAHSALLGSQADLADVVKAAYKVQRAWRT